MIPAPELVDRFRADLAAIWPLADDGMARLGLAVSGGPDSLALLLLAHAALPGRIAAATVDHGLRPEAAAEAAMVARVCARLGVPHATLRVRIEGGNVQSAARRARYAALDGWLAHDELSALVTAHHLDDQAETLIMRLNRGSGLSGLAGVRAATRVPGGDHIVLRPLLGWRRASLGAVVSAAGLAPASDPSNHDSRFDRVRVREALAASPWLDPEALARSATHLGEAEAYLADHIDAVWSACVHETDEGFVFTPASSDFEAVEIARRVLAALGRTPSRSDAAVLVARLREGENASLSGILARPRGASWEFAREPARRTS